MVSYRQKERPRQTETKRETDRQAGRDKENKKEIKYESETQRETRTDRWTDPFPAPDPRPAPSRSSTHPAVLGQVGRPRLREAPHPPGRPAVPDSLPHLTRSRGPFFSRKLSW